MFLQRLLFGTTKKAPTSEPIQPQTQINNYIADEFRQYINNEIPTRLIDTSTMKFIPRHALFDIFHPNIAQITDELINQRMILGSGDTNPESGIYFSRYRAALREIIRNNVSYIVFSHRWTTTEPTYQEIAAGAVSKHWRKSPGFMKLAQLCETAKALEYRFVWSDTCCIDKTNPMELGEAIHAMFKWYANSHLCIVHLAESSSSADFGRESWFTRGWTLQELLAPRRIKFYNNKWQPFAQHPIANDKEDIEFMTTLSTITGIPRSTIIADNSKGIKGHFIWEVMSWASKRKTTRTEDTAYCLLGLFNIHIPIMYGEGGKAFPRLIEAIVGKYGRWDVFAWAGQASMNHPVLPSSPACYPKFEQKMVSEECGMNDFALVSSGLRLKSVPLISMQFRSTTDRLGDVSTGGSFRVTLKPRRGPQSSMYGDVVVECGSERLRHIQEAKDLHVCILNYQPVGLGNNSGRLKVGREYVCFLLHMESRTAEGTGWLKFATENLLRISCKGIPSPMRASGTECGVFELPLQTTFIRAPQATI